MTSNLTSENLVIQNENSAVYPQKTVVDRKSKISKTATKKGGVRLGSRKALNDITNKSNVHQEESLTKNKLPKEELNIAEEMFLHDHKKCLEDRQKAMKPCFFDTVFPEYDSIILAENPTSKAKADLDNSSYYFPEPVELLMSELSDWLESAPRNSPLSSPITWDSPPLSPLPSHFEQVDFVLKQELND